MNKLWHDLKIIVIVIFLMVSSFRSALWIAQELNGFSSPPPRVPVPVSTAGAGRIMRISAYDAGACCTAPFADGLTASGVPAVGRIVAADPSIPFGTKLWIEGIGEYVVQDRGGAIKGDRLDILFATHEEAKQWGVQELMVKEVE